MRVPAALLVFLFAVALAGCGGEGSSSTGSTAASVPTEATTAGKEQGGGSSQKPDRPKPEKPDQGGDENGSKGAPAPAPPLPHDDSGGGVEQFHHKGSDNSIQESGSESSESQFEQAATALHGYLDAGAKRDWGTACFYLAKPIYEQLATTTRLAGKPCPQVLEAFFSAVPPRNFVIAAKADAGSFRVEDDHGFLLYHGAENLDYSMPMALEGGDWKVAAIAGSALL